jgi:hypothetical protein
MPALLAWTAAHRFRHPSKARLLDSDVFVTRPSQVTFEALIFPEDRHMVPSRAGLVQPRSCALSQAGECLSHQRALAAVGGHGCACVGARGRRSGERQRLKRQRSGLLTQQQAASHTACERAAGSRGTDTLSVVPIH